MSSPQGTSSASTNMETDLPRVVSVVPKQEPDGQKPNEDSLAQEASRVFFKGLTEHMDKARNARQSLKGKRASSVPIGRSVASEEAFEEFIKSTKWFEESLKIADEPTKNIVKDIESSKTQKDQQEKFCAKTKNIEKDDESLKTQKEKIFGSSLNARSIDVRSFDEVRNQFVSLVEHMYDMDELSSLTIEELGKRRTNAHLCIKDMRMNPERMLYNVRTAPLWIKICQKFIAVCNAKIGIINLDDKKHHLVEAELNAIRGLNDLRKDLSINWFLRTRERDVWSAQAGGPWGRARVLSDDVAMGMDYNGPPSVVEYSDLYQDACVILERLDQQAKVVETLCHDIIDVEEKARIRCFVYDVYRRVNKSLARKSVSRFEPAHYDWTNEELIVPKEDEWVAQSGYDALIKKWKIDERIASVNRPKGLGKNKQSQKQSGAKCYRQPGSSQPPRSNASVRRGAKDEIKLGREKKRLDREVPIEAQILSLPDIRVNMDAPAQLETLVGQIQNVVDNGVTVHVDLFSKAFETLETTYRTAVPYIKNACVGILVAYCVFRAYVTRSRVWKFLASIATIFASYVVIDEPLKIMISKISSWVNAKEGELDVGPPEEGEIVAQTAKDNIITATLAYVYASTFSGLRSHDMVTEYLKKCGDVPKWSNGLSFQLDFFMNSIQKFLNWISVKFDAPEFAFVQQPYPEAHSVMLEVDKTISAFQRGADYDYESGMAFYDLQKRVKAIQSKIPSNTPEGRDARKALESTLASMRPISARFERSSIVDNGPRVAPLGVLIAGPSGIGKTDIMTYFMNRVTAAIIPEGKLSAFNRNHNDVTYVRNPEVEFWDGYHGQFNIYLDDVGQTRDVAGTPNNEYMEVIRMIGPGSYPLNMAHLEDKGNTHFRSKVVYATTNRKKFELQSLHFNEPFCRRFEIAYVMGVRKEYAKEPFNRDPWERRLHHFPSERTDKSYVEFYPINPETGVVGDVSISYDELCHLTIQKYISRSCDGELMMRTHQEDKERYVSQRLGIKAQAGGVRSQPSLYETANDVIALDVSRIVRDSTPEGVGDSDDDILKALAEEVGASEAFVKQHVGKVDKDEDWYQLVAALRSLKEELMHDAPDTLRTLGSTVYKYFDKCSEYVTKAAKIIVENKAKVAAVLSALGALKFAMSYFTDENTGVQPQSETGFRKAAERHYRAPQTFSKKGERFKAFDLKPGKSNKGHRQLRGRGIESQMGSDRNTMDILRKVARRCQYVLKLPHADHIAGKITFIQPWIALAPLHFGERLQYGVDEGEYNDDSCISIWGIRTPNRVIDVPIKELQIVASEEGASNDWCLIKFPPVIERTPNIIRYFAKDTTMIDRGQFRMMINLVDDSDYLLEAKASVRKGVKYEQYDITNGYQYDIPTRAGDCGSLIGQCNPSVQTCKIIGIHTAGQGFKGFCPRIVQDDILHTLKAFDDVDTVAIEDQGLEDCDEDLDDDEVPGFKAQCRGRMVRGPTDTAIRPSPLRDTYCRSVMAPAKLRPGYVSGELIDPMGRARAKYSQPISAMDTNILELAKGVVTHNLMAKSSNDAPWEKPHVFSFEEAVAGISGVPFMEGIPRSTSAGYPFRLDVPKGHRGKSHFFGSEGDYDFSSDSCLELKARVASVIDEAKSGVRCMHVYMDFLKDERRPVDKVKAYKTRMVSASPIDLLIAHRMYFLDFVRWMMSNRIMNGSAVGINCYSSEWHLLATELLSVSSDGSGSIIAGDYSGFDGSISPQIQYAVLDIINKWYDDGNDLVRQVLWEDICASRHIVGDLIYEWSGSNPSGCFMTTTLNTLVNSLLINYCFIDQYVVHHGLGGGDDLLAQAARAAAKEMKYVCFGDDNLVSVSDNVKDFMNQTSFTHGLGKIGYTYTDEAKSGKTGLTTRRLDEVSFLKRSFRLSQKTAQYVCPLELGVILEMPMWTTKRDTAWVDVKSNVDTALKELALHERRVFDEWAPKILRYSLSELSYSPVVVSYEALQATCLAQEHMM